MEDDLRDARRRVTAAKGPKKDRKGGGKGKAPEPKDDEIPSEDDQENGQSDESDWVDSKCYSGCCSHTSPFRQLYQETWRLFLKCLNGIVWHMFQSGIDLGKHIVSKLADLLFWEHVFGFCCNQHAPIMYRSQPIEERLLTYSLQWLCFILFRGTWSSWSCFWSFCHKWNCPLFHLRVWIRSSQRCEKNKMVQLMVDWMEPYTKNWLRYVLGKGGTQGVLGTSW